MDLAYCKLNKNEEAINSFNKCLEIKKDYVKAYYKRGEAKIAI